MRRKPPLPDGDPRRERAKPSVVDRHQAVIGTVAQPHLSSREGRLAIELTDALKESLSIENGSVEVPVGWVAAVRRDQIRLSLGLEDPAFRSTIASNGARRCPDQPSSPPTD